MLRKPLGFCQEGIIGRFISGPFRIWLRQLIFPGLWASEKRMEKIHRFWGEMNHEEYYKLDHLRE